MPPTATYATVFYAFPFDQENKKRLKINAIVNGKLPIVRRRSSHQMAWEKTN